MLLILSISTLTGCNTKKQLFSTIDELSKENVVLLTQLQEMEEDLKIAQARIEGLQGEQDEMVLAMKESQSQLTQMVYDLEKQAEINQQPQSIRLVNTSEDSIYCVIEKETEYSETFSIIGKDPFGIEKEFFKITEVNGYNGNEFVYLVFYGTVYNLKHNQIDYKDGQNMEIIDTLYEREEISNEIIKITTYLSCGVPGEQVTWENEKGELFDIYLSNDGYGIDGTIILTAPLSELD